MYISLLIIVISGIILFILGIIFCLLISKLTRPKFGNIIVNTTDPEKDIFTLDFEKNPARLVDFSRVTFKIKNS